ncbi:MAG: hypothetical protein AAB518_01700 [Patescibacteria group bacterium]
METAFNRSPQNRIQSEKAVENSGAWRLMSFMLFVFVVFLLSYAGLSFGYSKFLEAQTEKVKAEISSLADLVSKDEQNAFLKFQFQLINLKDLLASHKTTSKFFSLIEANTNRNVQYRNLDINTHDGRMTLRGVAPSYAILAEQLAAYDRMTELESYHVTNSQVAENGFVNFNATLLFKPTVFLSP